MLDIIERFYNKIGTVYRVRQDIDKVFKENDIIELVEQESDYYLSKINGELNYSLPYNFRNKCTKEYSWMYINDLPLLEEYEDKLNLDEILNQISKCKDLDDLGDLESIIYAIQEKEKEIEFKQALKSKTLFKENKVYRINDNEYMIVIKIDEITHDTLKGDLLDIVYKENREIKLKKSSMFSHKYNTFIEMGVNVEDFLSSVRETFDNLSLYKEVK